MTQLLKMYMKEHKPIGLYAQKNKTGPQIRPGLSKIYSYIKGCFFVHFRD